MKNNRVTFAELARRSGVDPATVTRWVQRDAAAKRALCPGPSGASAKMRFLRSDRKAVQEFIAYHRERLS